jgi:hypothetical protein
MKEHSEWVSLWSLLNLIGVILFLFTTKISYTFYFKRQASSRKTWSFNPGKLFSFGSILLCVSFITQIYIYASFGGIGGFINAFSERQSVGLSEYNPFKGYGLAMLIAESFKVLLPIMVIYLFRNSPSIKTRKGFISMMFIFLILFLFFGGLRGSRSSTLFSLFFAAGMYHFYIQPISRKMVILGGIAFILFSSGYYWYKIAGSNGISAIWDSSSIDVHSEREDVTKYLISRDLGRMDIQSLALKRHLSEDYEYSLGRTYLVSIFSSIPKQIIPYSPDQITKEKTEILYGEGRYSPGSIRQTTLVMGQFGESFINFGIPGIFFFFCALGWLSGWIQCLIYKDNSGVELFVIPFSSLFIVLFLITDMNVIMYQATRYLLIPSLLVIFCLQYQTRET